MNNCDLELEELIICECGTGSAELFYAKDDRYELLLRNAMYKNECGEIIVTCKKCDKIIGVLDAGMITSIDIQDRG